MLMVFVFFFQAEDGIRDTSVTGVQTCALPISGVPQGSVLGPLLFLLFIEDMPCNVKYSDCRLYADDTLLCCADKNQAQLQEDVNALVVWSCNWGRNSTPKNVFICNLANLNPSSHC